MKLTILMPCLNEAETLGTCITKANNWIKNAGIEAEVLIADNGSTDGSQTIAQTLGARVITISQRGYGAALFHGCMAANGEYIIMGDADDSYDFGNLDIFIQKLDDGFDLVMGNRFLGEIAPGAMPWKNKYIGNPILSWIGRLFFSSPIKDFHCGLRGFRKEAFLSMDLRTTGMEFASEMVIKASLYRMRIAEVPTNLAKDGRSRPPHLRPWRDGWRHLRFMLLYSPRWLFIVPGLLVLIVSTLLYLTLLFGPTQIGPITFDLHTLFYAQSGLFLGVLSLVFGTIIRMIGMREGLLQDHSLLNKMRSLLVLEAGSITGLLMIITGIYLSVSALLEWGDHKFGDLGYGEMLRMVSLSSTLILLGGIALGFSIIIGFLSLPTKSVDKNWRHTC